MDGKKQDEENRMGCIGCGRADNRRGTWRIRLPIRY